MYRCKDCKKEYIEYVEYCDCGNNTFDVITETVVKSEKHTKEPLSLEQKSKIVSVGFFLICLFLSVIVWIIPVKSEHQEVKIAEKNPIVKNIPAIDKIWDSTPNKIVEEIQSKQENDRTFQVVKNKQPIPLNAIPYDNISTKPNKPVVNKPKTEPKGAQKTQTTQTTKPVTQNAKPASVQPKTVENAAKKAPANPIQASQSQTKSQPQPKESKPQVTNADTNSKNQTKVQEPDNSKSIELKVEPPKKVYNPNSPEMLKYKGELRAVLFQKFPVGSIQGSGTCSVHFSVDSTGKLINRGFSKTSDNKSLNDAVYYMLMSVPKFKAPPSSYSGETINMNFSIKNGSYEITIH